VQTKQRLEKSHFCLINSFPVVSQLFDVVFHPQRKIKVVKIRFFCNHTSSLKTIQLDYKFVSGPAVVCMEFTTNVGKYIDNRTHSLHKLHRKEGHTESLK